MRERVKSLVGLYLYWDYIMNEWVCMYVCMYKSIYIGYRITRIYAHDSRSKELCGWLAVFELFLMPSASI